MSRRTEAGAEPGPEREARRAARQARRDAIEARELAALDPRPSGPIDDMGDHLEAIGRYFRLVIDRALQFVDLLMARAVAREIDKGAGWGGRAALGEVVDALDAFDHVCRHGFSQDEVDEARLHADTAISHALRGAELDCHHDLRDDDGPCEDQALEVETAPLRSLISAAAEIHRLRCVAAAGDGSLELARIAAAEQVIYAPAAPNAGDASWE